MKKEIDIDIILQKIEKITKKIDLLWDIEGRSSNIKEGIKNLKQDVFELGNWSYELGKNNKSL